MHTISEMRKLEKVILGALNLYILLEAFLTCRKTGKTRGNIR